MPYLQKDFKTVRRVLAINDLSGHSHTSLMVVIPIMQSMGITVTALPTAILSSNTEQNGFSLVEMTPHLPVFFKQWKDLKLKFDAIYSGFLCSEQQIEIVMQSIKQFIHSELTIIVDPVMADNGELYPCFKPDIIKAMRRLISAADVITPNLTEAAFLLEQEYHSNLTENDVKSYCMKLTESGPNRVVITNVPVPDKPKLTSAVGYDRKLNLFHRSICRCLPIQYPGTGDIFTSVLTAQLLKGTEFFSAIDITVKFVFRAMQMTRKLQTPPREGIALEHVLKYLPIKPKSIQ